MQVQQSASSYPLVYGSLSYPTASKRTEKYSNWIVYVRGSQFEDISGLVRKVVFHLHESFQRRIREITAAPFEVKEAGWGAFDILIQVYLKTGALLEFKHNLRLHHLHTPNQSKKPLVSEYLDELLFLNPTREEKAMLARVEKAPRPTIPEEPEDEDLADYRTHMQFARFMNKFDTKEEETRLEDSVKFINFEIRGLKDRLALLDEQLEKGYAELAR